MLIRFQYYLYHRSSVLIESPCCPHFCWSLTVTNEMLLCMVLNGFGDHISKQPGTSQSSSSSFLSLLLLATEHTLIQDAGFGKPEGVGCRIRTKRYHYFVIKN